MRYAALAVCAALLASCHHVRKEAGLFETRDAGGVLIRRFLIPPESRDFYWVIVNDAAEAARLRAVLKGLSVEASVTTPAEYAALGAGSASAKAAATMHESLKTRSILVFAFERPEMRRWEPPALPDKADPSCPPNSLCISFDKEPYETADESGVLIKRVKMTGAQDYYWVVVPNAAEVPKLEALLTGVRRRGIGWDPAGVITPEDYVRKQGGKKGAEADKELAEYAESFKKHTAIVHAYRNKLHDAPKR